MNKQGSGRVEERDQITNLRVLMAELQEHNQPLYMCFIDFQKAFDSVQHEKLWWAMLDMGYPPHLGNLLANLYKSQRASVKLRQILGISWQVHKTNESILQETG